MKGIAPSDPQDNNKRRGSGAAVVLAGGPKSTKAHTGAGIPPPPGSQYRGYDDQEEIRTYAKRMGFDSICWLAGPFDQAEIAEFWGLPMEHDACGTRNSFTRHHHEVHQRTD